MIEPLIELDKEIFLVLNNCHHPLLDMPMYFATKIYTWLPLFILCFYYSYRKNGFLFLKFLVLIGVAIVLSDQTASGVFKPWIQRLRPCHDPIIAQAVHLVKGCGGKYGFFSSHAANSFAVATLFYFWIKQHYQSSFALLFFVWAAFFSYTRIYLGVHFPLDIVTGMFFGLMYGSLTWLIGKNWCLRPFNQS